VAFNAATTIDTDNATPSGCVATTGTSANGYCVVAGTDISVAANVRAIGTKPLVLIATQTLTVSANTGVIDVGSHRNPPAPTNTEFYGAGANPTICQSPNGPGPGGGGAGGSFLTLGGTGGAGTGASAVGGTPGPAIPLAAQGLVHGGCPGQTSNGTAGIIFGAGGGAVYLIAGKTITIGGTVIAGGAGARSGLPIGASGGDGAGGGGSGGMIGLDAPTIIVTGLLIANGGGGGSGGNAIAGHSGDDALTTMAPDGGGSNSSANGSNAGAGFGGDGSSGGAGGNGSAAKPANAQDIPGGGGGGGGAGVILVPATASQALDTNPGISPPVTRM
jgi:hypothetical protein